MGLTCCSGDRQQDKAFHERAELKAAEILQEQEGSPSPRSRSLNNSFTDNHIVQLRSASKEKVDESEHQTPNSEATGIPDPEEESFDQVSSLPRATEPPRSFRAQTEELDRPTGWRFSDNYRQNSARFSTGSATSSNSAAPQNKIMIMGSKKVGKSSLIMRWWNGTFAERCTTVFKQKQQEFPDGRIEKVRFQEIQERGIKLHTRNSIAAIFIYDASRYESMNDLQSLYTAYMEAQRPEGVPRYIIGNKSDLAPQAGNEDARSFFKDEEARYYTISTRNGDGFDDLMSQILNSIW